MLTVVDIWVFTYSQSPRVSDGQTVYLERGGVSRNREEEAGRSRKEKETERWKWEKRALGKIRKESMGSSRDLE